MEVNIYLTKLFDYYGCLLTDKQQQYFTDYYMENLSITEISENNSVSRNAAYKQIKDAEKNLINYENKLHLEEKERKIKKLLNNISEKEIKEEILDLI